MSEKRFSGWTLLLIVALVLAVSGVAVAGGLFLGFKIGRVTADWRWRADFDGRFFHRMPDRGERPFFYGLPHFHDMPYPYGVPHPYGMPQMDQFPAPDTRPDRETLPETPRRAQPYLGVIFQPITPELAEEHDLPVEQGAWIMEVVEGSPAEQSELREGDIVVAVNGQLVNADRTLADLILQYDPGDEVELTVRRGPRALTFSVVLGQRPLGRSLGPAFEEQP